MRLDPSRSRLAIAFALLALLALSGPGVVAAHAESDLAPTADELFAMPAQAPAQLAPPAACDPARAQAVAMNRRQAAAKLARLMGGAGQGRSLRNGMGYQVQRDPLAQIRRIEAEAAAQHPHEDQ